MPQLSIVAPLYNESETFPNLIERLNQLMDSTHSVLLGQTLDIEVVLVDDGSRDNTAELMQQLALTDARYHIV